MQEYCVAATREHGARGRARRAPRARPTVEHGDRRPTPVSAPGSARSARLRANPPAPPRACGCRAGGRGPPATRRAQASKRGEVDARLRRPSRAASRRGPRWRCCRWRRPARDSRRARRSSTRSSSTPACSAASTLASPCPRVLWKCAVSSTSAPSALARSARRTRRPAAGWPSRWCRRSRSPGRRRHAGARRSRAPARAARGPRRGSRRRSRSRASQRRPASRARASTLSRSLSDSATERLTFWRLWVSRPTGRR